MYLFFYMGRCYEEKQLYNEAIKHYGIAIEAHNKFPEAFYRLGKIQEKLNNAEEALKYYKKTKGYINYKMQEPYIERFDEMFRYIIGESIEDLKSNKFPS